MSIDEQKVKLKRSRIKGLKDIFFAMIAEIDLVVKNLINIFFISRFLGPNGAAAYEVVMPCIMVVSACVALGYNGVQAVCSKDYGAKDFESFDRHKNAGYTWMITVMAALTIIFAIFKSPILNALGANDGSAVLAQLSSECYTMFLLCFIPQSIFSLAACLMYFEEQRHLFIMNIILYGSMIVGNVIVTIFMPSMTGYMLINVVGIVAADFYIIKTCFISGRKNSRAAFTSWNMKPADIRESFLTGLPDFMEYGFVGIMYWGQNLYLLSRFSESVVAGVSVFEAIDNLPEMICVGFSFLVTTMLGIRVGRLRDSSGDANRDEARDDFKLTAKRITAGGIIGALLVTALMLVLAKPLVGLFMASGDSLATESAVLLTVSSALGFVFYILNSELVSYYKIVGAYIPAHIVFFVEVLLFPLGFKLILGELFGTIGFCIGGTVGEVGTFILNIFIICKNAGRFPREISDFRMDKYLQRTLNVPEKRNAI